MDRCFSPLLDDQEFVSDWKNWFHDDLISESGVHCFIQPIACRNTFLVSDHQAHFLFHLTFLVPDIVTPLVIALLPVIKSNLDQFLNCHDPAAEAHGRWAA